MIIFPIFGLLTIGIIIWYLCHTDAKETEADRAYRRQYLLSQLKGDDRIKAELDIMNTEDKIKADKWNAGYIGGAIAMQNFHLHHYK